MAKSKKSIKRKIDLGAHERRPFLLWSILTPALLIAVLLIWHYRAGLQYYVSTIFDRSKDVGQAEKNKHDARNIFVMSAHDDKIFGVDISEYQGRINWDTIGLINDRFPIDFVFVRATMGERGNDKRYLENWKQVNRISKLRGAYHYFRPNENSLKQADNFIKTVKLKPGDLPPVLDIEERPRHQSMDSLRRGLKRWLDKVEKHYDIRPIVYSGDSYFTDFLEKEFQEYTLWIANYNFWIEKPKDHWHFWQFSEKGSVNGIRGYVDLNMYNGEIEALERLCIPYK